MKKINKTFRPLAAWALLVCSAALSLAAVAQDASFPSKPIRMIIPSTPGGGTDFIGRLISQKISETAGWSVVVENRPGATGTVGLGEVSRAKADGYELAIGQTMNVALAPWLMKLTFDPAKDLTPIAIAVESAMVLSVPDNSPVRSWADLVKAAKAASGKPLNYGTAGTGSVAQVAMEQVQDISGIKLQHVPYKGSAPALTDLMGGHLDMTGTSLASALPFIKGGKVRAIAVTSLKRSAAMPDVPSLAELGYANFNQVEWYGVFAPAGISQAMAERLNAAVNAVLQRPEVRAAIIAQGQEPKIATQAAFAATVKADNQSSQAVIAKAGIKLE